MFSIISDGSCDLSIRQLEQAEIDTVPFYVTLDGISYKKEMAELDVSSFYRCCVDDPKLYPRSSMPTVQDYIDVFEKHLSRDRDILCFCISRKFSGSCGSAVVARDMLMEKYPDRRICVLDSTLVTGLQGLLLLELARYRSEGHSLDETLSRFEEIKGTAAIYFTIENLNYLTRGGRLGKLSELAAKGQGIRPLIRFSSGELFPAGITIGRKRSFVKLRDCVKNMLKDRAIDPRKYSFALGWGSDRAEAEAFFELIYRLFEEEYGYVPEFVFIQIGATIGVHTGPYPVGMGLIEKA